MSKLKKAIAEALAELAEADRGHWSRAGIVEIVVKKVQADLGLLEITEVVTDAVAADDRRRLAADGKQGEMFVADRPLALGQGERVFEARASEDDTHRNYDVRRVKEFERRAGWDTYAARRQHEFKVFAQHREAGTPLADQGEMYGKGFGYKQQSLPFDVDKNA